MKRKSAIVIAILIMAIGFASISTTLIINGNTKVSENTEDFDIYFSKAVVDNVDVYEKVTSQDKKIITFETSELKTLNQTSVLNYEVTNNSSNYDAEIQINCKVKDNTEAKYTSIKNELEGNATKVKAKETLNGTLTITLNKTSTQEIKEEYVCALEFNAVERDTVGINIPDPVSFTTDSWETIQKAVKVGNTSKYNVGDTKEIELVNFGTHTVRIANKSECTTETSETACGFVVEFADIVITHSFNSTNTNVGGWRVSEIRSYVNNDIFNALPNDLQNVIAMTKVISGYGSTSGETNYETQDKLYLLSTQEVWSNNNYDTSLGTSKQLDYYKSQGVTTDNYARAIKQYNGSNCFWWLRAAASINTNAFLGVRSYGDWGSNDANGFSGVSPAFRIA